MPRLEPHQIKTEHGSDELGSYSAELLSDSGGLTQFGAFIETLAPRSQSSRPHWHRSEDEMVYMLSGTVTLIEGNTQTPLLPGDTATFAAGVPVGHCLRNDGDTDARYLVIGTRSGDDVGTYTDNGDVLTVKDGVKTLRNAAGDVLKTTPYHGA